MIVRLHVNQRRSLAVVHNGLIFLSGQVASSSPGAPVAEQTSAILDTIDGLLAECGSNKSRLLSATIWLTDIASFAEMNGMWDAWVPPGHAPARACVEARLAAPTFTVEIAVVAAVSDPTEGGGPHHHNM